VFLAAVTLNVDGVSKKEIFHEAVQSGPKRAVRSIIVYKAQFNGVGVVPAVNNII
jgi:hypothetical protein